MSRVSGETHILSSTVNQSVTTPPFINPNYSKPYAELTPTLLHLLLFPSGVLHSNYVELTLAVSTLLWSHHQTKMKSFLSQWVVQK